MRIRRTTGWASGLLFFGLLFFVLPITTGCLVRGSRTDFLESGASKAAFDMQCEKEKLEITELAHGSMGVRGCGKQGRYEYVTGTGWVLNAEERPAEK